MKAIILILVLFILFSQDCFAYNVNDALTEKIDLSSFYEMLPDVVKGICGENEVLSGQAVSELLHELVNEALESFYDQLVSAWSPAAQTLLIVLICSILSVFLNEKKYNFLFVCIGGTAIIYVCIADVESYFSYSIRVIQELYEFSTVMLPCMATVSVLTGATISTGVKYTAASLFMNILLNFCNSFLIPLVSMYMATVVGYEVFGQKILGVISNFIRWGCLTVLTGTIVLFTSYLTV